MFRVGDRARIKVWCGWIYCVVERTVNYDGYDMAEVSYLTQWGWGFSEWRLADELRFPHGGDGDFA